MKRILDIRFIFIAVVLMVVAACGQNTDQATEPGKEGESAAAQASDDPVEEAETSADPFASTLKGDALEQYRQLSQEGDLDLEAMAMFLGSEMVTEWLIVLSGPESERFASTLKGDDASEIQVGQFEQYETQSPGAAPRVSDSESARFPFERDGRYLLFLLPQGRVSSMPDLFLGVAAPYRFKLTDGEAKADGPLGDLFRGLHGGREAIFPDTSEQSLVDQVQAIVVRPSGT